ncbi:MAG: alpha/beta hydrolase [Caulobacterales bacterium]
MTTKHLVDPELLGLLEIFPKFDYSLEGIAGVRATVEQMSAAIPQPDVPVDASSRKIPGLNGAPDISVSIYRPKGVRDQLPAYLHIHGGGYVAGSPALSDAQNRCIAHEAQCVVISVDYRLAPETAHPGQLQDCYAALLWAHENAASLGIDPKRIAVGGESAGGGLAAALAQYSLAQGEVSIVFQVLIYPMLDDRTASAAEPSPWVGEYAWTRADNRFGWSSILGQKAGLPEAPEFAVPARAASLKGLPPAFIGVGSLDLFFEEDVAYAMRLNRDGVTTELHVYPGAFHAFDLAAEAAVSQAAWRNMIAALKRGLKA